MSKRVTHRLTYDAPATDVYRMLTTPAFREEVCTRLRVISAAATAEPVDDGIEVVIDQVQPAKGLPSFATKLLGDTIRIVQRERWTTPQHADVDVTIPGKPGEMSGTARLEESGGVTTEVVELDIKVRIPLVGGKIESLVADMLVKALEAENATGRDYLSR
jgi:hypothetical protein